MSYQDMIHLAVFVVGGGVVSFIFHAWPRARLSHRENEDRLRHSLECSGVACWDVNISAGTFWRSGNLPEIFGRSDSDFATTYEGFFAYIYPEDREFFRLATVTGTAQERSYEITHRIVRGDGAIGHVQTRGRIFLGEHGGVKRMVGTVFAVNPREMPPMEFVTALAEDLASVTVD